MIILSSFLIVISIILVVLLYIQAGRVRSLGSSIVGTKDVELFENYKKRGTEKTMHIITWILVIMFISICVIIMLFF